MKRLILGLCLFGAIAASCADNREEHFLRVDGLQRRYLLHLPPQRFGQAKSPVILMLHGGGGTPEHTGSRDLETYGDPAGFLVVYPEGLKRSWNDGRLIQGRTYDDVGFLSALIDELVAKYNADPKRVYVTGISNGGFMAFTLACRIPYKIAAIAPVAASMGVGAIEDCHPRSPVSVLMINGTADPLVKFEGGKVLRREGSEAEPVSKVVQFWRTEVCGSDVPVARKKLPDTDPNDGSTVQVEQVSCRAGNVRNYTVTGGGHTWPGGLQYLPKFIVGSVNRDFSASEEIVKFFEAH